MSSTRVALSNSRRRAGGAGVAAAPADVRVTPLASSALVSWSPSVDHATTDTYLVTASTGQTASVAGNGKTVATVTGLPTTTGVTFTVAAVVGGVTGASSAASPSVTTATPVTVTAGGNIATAVTAAATNAIIVVEAGTYSNQTVTPKTGQHIILSDGVIMDGGGTTVYAFESPGGVLNVTIRGIGTAIVRNYNPPTDPQAAIGHHGVGCTGWVIDNLDVTGITGGAGIRLITDGWIRNCNVHDMTCKVGVTGYQTNNAKIVNNTFTNINSADLHDPGWDAGGIKIVDCDNGLTEWNTSYSNRGPGLWWDIACTTQEIRYNRVYSNIATGIFYEMSTTAIIHHNTVYSNGTRYTTGWGIHDSNILISHCPDVEVYENDVWGGVIGIMGWQDDNHEGRPAAFLGGNEALQDLNVHDNRLSQNGRPILQETALATLNINSASYTWTAADYYNNLNNHFENNTYYGTSHHRFSDAGTDILQAAWQAFGNDDTGTWLAATAWITETFTGTNGASPSTSTFAAGLNRDGVNSTGLIQTNRFQVITSATAAYGGYFVQATVSAPFVSGNYEVACDILIGTVEEKFARINARIPNEYTQTGYRLQFNIASNSVEIDRIDNYVYTALGTAVAYTFTTSDTVHVRYQVNGSTIRARLWRNSETEPGTWLLSYTSATYTTGHVALGLGGGNAAATKQVEFDNLVVTGL